MSTVQDGDITITSSDETEAEIREHAFAPVEDLVPSPAADPGEKTEAAPATEEAAAVTDQPRSEDGKFQAKKAKPRDDPYARVKDATAKEAAAKRERDEARTENARLKAELEQRRQPEPPRVQPPPQHVQPPPQETPQQAFQRYVSAADAPKRDQFTNDGEHAAALQIFITDKRYEERRHGERQQERAWLAQQADTERRSKLYERVTAARTADVELGKKFDAIQQAGDQFQISQPMRDFVIDSALGPQLLGYLWDHQDEAQRLATLPPDKAFGQMGRLEMRLEAASSAGSARQTPVLSKASPPPKPVGSSPTVSDTGDDEDDTEDMSERAVLRHIRRENALDPRINPRAARR